MGKSVNITNQQIESEIAELLAEADRKVASVNVIFKEAALIRKQVEHLKHLLVLRMQADRNPELISFVMLGYVRENEEQPSPLCAFTWSGSADMPTDIHILLKSDWKRLVSVDTFSYFNDLLNDWTDAVQTQPDMVLAMIAKLSVGPIRTLEQDTLHRVRVEMVVKERLGDVLRFPGVMLGK